MRPMDCAAGGSQSTMFFHQQLRNDACICVVVMRRIKIHILEVVRRTFESCRPKILGDV